MPTKTSKKTTVKSQKRTTKPRAKAPAKGKRQPKGGDFLGSFLSGIAAPFRIARNINPVFDFGVGKLADAVGVPKKLGIAGAGLRM